MNTKKFALLVLFVANLSVPAAVGGSVNYFVLEGEPYGLVCNTITHSGAGYQFERELCTFFLDHDGAPGDLIANCARDTCIFGVCPLVHVGKNAGPIESCEEFGGEPIAVDGWFYGDVKFVLRVKE